MESKLKHLEIIQSVVSRMAGNSFMLKGWSVTLVSALFALAAKDSNTLFLFVSYIPCVCFWVLDAYFLRQERLYRALYNQVAKKQEIDIDFSPVGRAPVPDIFYKMSGNTVFFRPTKLVEIRSVVTIGTHHEHSSSRIHCRL